MGGDSNSKSDTTTTQVDQTFNFVEGTGDGDRFNFGLSEGASVGDVEIQQTDHGAIDAARVAFESAAGMNNVSAGIAENAFSFAEEANDNFYSLGLNTTERAFDSANDFAAKSFDLVSENHDFARDLNSDSLSFASDTLNTSMSAVMKEADLSRKQTADQISRAFSLAQLHSRSEGGEAMDKAISALKVGAGVAGGIVVLKMVADMRKGK